MRLNRAYERLSGGRSSDDDPPPPPRAFHVWEGMCGCASAETIPSCGRSRRAFFGEGYLGHSVVGRWHREISSHSLGSHPLGSHRKEHGQRGLARQRAKRVSMVGRRVGATVGGGVSRLVVGHNHQVRILRRQRKGTVQPEPVVVHTPGRDVDLAGGSHHRSCQLADRAAELGIPIPTLFAGPGSGAGNSDPDFVRWPGQRSGCREQRGLRGWRAIALGDSAPRGDQARNTSTFGRKVNPPSRVTATR